MKLPILVSIAAIAAATLSDRTLAQGRLATRPRGKRSGDDQEQGASSTRRKLGKEKASGKGCYENKGYAYLSELVHDPSKCTFVPDVSDNVDRKRGGGGYDRPKEYERICVASGGVPIFGIHAEVGDSQPQGFPLACCPICEFDIEALLEEKKNEGECYVTQGPPKSCQYQGPYSKNFEKLSPETELLTDKRYINQLPVAELNGFQVQNDGTLSLPVVSSFDEIQKEKKIVTSNPDYWARFTMAIRYPFLETGSMTVCCSEPDPFVDNFYNMKSLKKLLSDPGELLAKDNVFP